MENKTYSDCERLLIETDIPQQIRDHCRAVSELSIMLAEELNIQGCTLDSGLCGRAGLLHDICRTEDQHDQKGGEFLEKQGFIKEADITRTHMGKGIDCNNESLNINENDVVYLADKLIMGTMRVSIQKRFESALEKYGDDAEAEHAIREKWFQAMFIQKKVESILNRKISDV